MTRWMMAAALASVVLGGTAHAQNQSISGTWTVGSDCNAQTFSGGTSNAVGAQIPQPVMVDSHGNVCVTGGAGAGGGGSGVQVALDASQVVTGGTAVTALAAGHRTHGGWLANPSTAAINLCINELATASGTTSAGSLTCIVPGQTYVLAASAAAVSVVSSDSAHAFSGYGMQ